jgi:hypothetical protein
LLKAAGANADESAKEPTVLRLLRQSVVVALACVSIQPALLAAGPSTAMAYTDGVRRLVHTDPVESMPELSRPARASSGSASAQSAAPACSTTHSKGYQMIYARPSDVPSRLATLQADFLADAATASERVTAESGGSPVRFRFLCGIADVNTGQPSSAYGSDPLLPLMSHLSALGYNLSSRKYLVWWDGPQHPFACGEGTFSDDESASPATNNNNVGPDYAVVYKPAGGDGGFCGWTTVLHEIGHTLGAVMHGAPHSTPGWHCTDENDVMCYRDGAGVTTTTVCNVSTPAFDCNKDDYFSTSPAAGSYLATHWNTFNSSFLEPATATPPAPGVPDTTITQKPSAMTTATSATFAFSASETGATFTCTLNGTPSACASPVTYTSLPESTHTFTVAATSVGGTDPSPASHTWTVDATAPTVTLTQPGAVLLTHRKITLAWSSPNAGPGARHQIRYRSASAWSGFGGYALWREQSTAGATFEGSPGRTYCFQVNVIDAAGNQSGWSNERCSAVPLDDRSGTASGVDRGTGSSFYQGTISIGRRTGGSLTFSNVRARSFSVLVQMCSSCRYIDVYWNGTVIKKMNLQSSTAKWVHVPLISFGGVSSGTLKFVVRSPVAVIDAVGASQV